MAMRRTPSQPEPVPIRLYYIFIMTILVTDRGPGRHGAGDVADAEGKRA